MAIVFDPEVSASTIVTTNLKEHASYTTASVIPNYVDGLKKVQRRAINILGDHPQNMKLKTLVGDVLKLHVHGDVAVEDAIIRLAQPFNQALPLVHITGNVGSASGEDPPQADIWISPLRISRLTCSSTTRTRKHWRPLNRKPMTTSTSCPISSRQSPCRFYAATGRSYLDGRRTSPCTISTISVNSRRNSSR